MRDDLPHAANPWDVVKKSPDFSRQVFAVRVHNVQRVIMVGARGKYPQQKRDPCLFLEHLFLGKVDDAEFVAVSNVEGPDRVELVHKVHAIRRILAGEGSLALGSARVFKMPERAFAGLDFGRGPLWFGRRGIDFNRGAGFDQKFDEIVRFRLIPRSHVVSSEPSHGQKERGELLVAVPAAGSMIDPVVRPVQILPGAVLNEPLDHGQVAFHARLVEGPAIGITCLGKLA